jgi:beta-phosphoglucomutase-like phosphatase (HAD superfamily)
LPVLPAASVVALEDTRLGIAAAKAAGLHVVAITNTTEAIELRDADVVIRRFAELPSAVEVLNVSNREDR